MDSLSEGLEGRSNNQVALLLDTLLCPDADIGELHPSSIRWEYHPSRAVSHVVIGRGNPGGFWQFMDPDTLTLSLENWLQLPLYSFEQWKLDREGVVSGSHVTSSSEDDSRRAFCGDIADYYSDYVTKMGLKERFINDTEICQTDCLEKDFINTEMQSQSSAVVSQSSCSPSPPSLLSPASPTKCCFSSGNNCITTSTSWDRLTDICSQISDPEDCGVYCSQRRVSKNKWYLYGSQKKNGVSDSKVCTFSKKLVLACGVYGKPRYLDVPGEQEFGFLTHDFSEFSRRVRTCDGSGTVLIVGAGLSAADGVLLALKRGVKVVHVFHKDPYSRQLIFDRMPEKVYPDYKHVHRLMQGEESDSRYFSCARSQVSEFRENSFVVQNESGHEQLWSDVAIGGVFIGTNAELGFLPKKLVLKLGMNPDEPIHSKRNPVDINPISFVTEASTSLYAIGSLVGDNFVRFGVGSSLGVAQHILGLSSSSQD